MLKIIFFYNSKFFKIQSSRHLIALFNLDLLRYPPTIPVLQFYVINLFSIKNKFLKR